MLCDFAITPHSLEQSGQSTLAPSVAAGLAHFVAQLNAFDAGHLVVLSDVCAGMLSKRLFDLSKIVTADSDKQLISGLRKRLTDLGISRPVPSVAADDESCAISSAQLKPRADRIIASQGSTSDGMASWASVKEPAFYEPLFPWRRRSPGSGDQQGQLDYLYPILARAEFIVLILPYFYVRQDNQHSPIIPGGDMEFAIRLAEYWRSAQTGSRKNQLARLEIRTNRRSVDRAGNDRAPDQKRAMEHLLRSIPRTNVFWDRSINSREPYRDRRLLAGVEKAGKRDYRWGVNLGHPANEQSSQHGEPAAFAPMNREDIAACASTVRSFTEPALVTT